MAYPFQRESNPLFLWLEEEGASAPEVPATSIEESFYGNFPGSFDDTREKVRTAIQAALPVESTGYPAYCDIVAMFNDSAVIQKSGKYFKYNYATSEDEVTVSGPVEVAPKFVETEKRGPGRPRKVMNSAGVSYSLESEIVWEDVETDLKRVEEQFFTFVEGEAEDDGRTWPVVLIRAGTSQNRMHYSKDLLKKSVKMYEGVHAYADHPPLSELRDRRGGRSIRDIVGYYTDVKYEEADGGRLKAKLHVVEGDSVQWLVDLLNTSVKAKNPIVGLSHNIGYTKQATESKVIGGVNATVLSEIAQVFSVDIVARPSAGGEIITHEQVEDSEVKYKTLAELKTGNSVAYESLMSLRERDWDLFVLQAINFVEEVGDKPEAKPDPTPAPTPEPVAVQTAQEGLQTNVAVADPRIDALQKGYEQMQLRACESTLAASLAAYPKMPQRLRDNIKERFAGRIFEETELESAVKFAKDLWADMAKASKQVATEGLLDPTDSQISPRDFMVARIDNFWEQETTQGPNGDKIRPFKSIRQMYAAWEGVDNFDVDPRTIIGVMKERRVLGSPFDSNIHVRLEDNEIVWSRVMEDLNTATFGEIWADRMHKRFLKDWADLDVNADWKKVVSDIGSVSDFRTHRATRFGGYGTLSVVAENELYPDAPALTDEEVTYAVEKYGMIERLTFESIVNDDMGALRKIPSRLARSAEETQFRAVMDKLRLGFTSGVVWDGNPLFDALHSNIVTGAPALSHAAVSLGRAAMRKQAAYGESTAILGWKPKYLIVPTDLEDTAWRIAKSNVYGVVSVAAENTTTPNLHQGLEPLVVDYWTDANNWILMADPRVAETIGVYYLNGREAPELFVQDSPTEGDNYKYDRQSYKVRHIFDTVVLDYRGVQGSNPA